MSDKKRSVKDIIEHKLLPIVSVVVIFAGAIRSASAWSEGTFNLNSLPGPIVHTLDAIIGLSLSSLMEMVMVLAGIAWIGHLAAKIEVQFDQSIPAQARKAQSAYHKMWSWITLCFSVLGGLCSVAGQMYFALSQEHPTTGGVVIDIISAILITVCIFYVFVLHEPKQDDPAKEVQRDLLGAFRGILVGIADKVREGRHNNQDVRTLQKAMPFGQKKVLEALLVPDSNEAMWDVATIASKLGLETESGKRMIRRAIANAKDDVTYGIVEKQHGKGYEMPWIQAVRLFSSEFEARIAIGADRQQTGGYGNDNPEIFGIGQSAIGQ